MVATAADVQPEPSAQEAQMVEDVDAKQAQIDAAVLATVEGQTGGAFTYAFTQAAADYKKQTLEMFPNRVNYKCFKKLSGGFCHAAYMGIGFLSAIRVPILLYRDSAGKLGIKTVRKLEPKVITDFIGSIDSMSPHPRYYAIVDTSSTQTGGYRRGRTQRSKKIRKGFTRRRK